MDTKVFGPSMIVDDVSATAAFYVDHLGFTVIADLGWFA